MSSEPSFPSENQAPSNFGHIEPLSAILRIPGGYGEAYDWCCVVRYLSPFEVQLDATLIAPNLKQARNIKNLCKASGILRCTMVRIKQGKKHVVVIYDKTAPTSSSPC